MQTKKLKPKDLKTFDKPGRYSDGGGLYFCIGYKGERKFTFRYKSRTERYGTGDPKVHELGLGGAPRVSTSLTEVAASLAAARRNAEEMVALLKSKQDPLTVKRGTAEPLPTTRTVALPIRSQSPTFGEFADDYVAAKVTEFKNPIHIKQWIRSVKVQAAPLRELPINEIDTTAVLSVLRPIWAVTPESAKRLQERIEKVLNAATVEGHREGPNPARWVGHLKETTLSTRKSEDRKNHAAVPFGGMPSFMADLRKLTSMSARAFEFTILTIARTGETIGARWSEINLETAVWTVPKERMKKNKEHRVPLGPRCLAILSDLRTFSKMKPDDFVFQSGSKGLSSGAMSECLKGLRDGATVHGMRSAFSDWANDTTQHDRQVIEFALAHIIGDKAEAAYRRGDAFEKRRALLLDWEIYLR